MKLSTVLYVSCITSFVLGLMAQVAETCIAAEAGRAVADATTSKS